MLHAGKNIFEGIPVEVVRKRIRRMNLRVLPDGLVCLSIPTYWATLHEGEAFLRAKLDWVRKVRADLRTRPRPRPAATEAELAALRTLLDELNATWSRVLGEADVTWKLRKAKSFWGSCNWRTRQITYNPELAGVPRDLVEYVVVHEFTHFRAHDHGPEFHALMEARLPGWRKLRRALNTRAWLKSEVPEEPFLPPSVGTLVQDEFSFG